MSKTPTVFEPKGAFTYLLARIKEYNPTARKTDISPHIRSFLADPTIKELLDGSQAPAAAVAPATQLPGDEIQATLNALSLAITSIQKKLAEPHKQQQSAPPTAKRGAGPSTTASKKYLAIAGTRPPNPSLVVDLAHLKITDENWPKPEDICQTLNKRLGEVTPPQVSLAAVRWTVKGNLVISKKVV